ncbi:MAG TPA: purine-nucleoside phosphorylase [Rubrivivax sp.]
MTTLQAAVTTSAALIRQRAGDRLPRIAVLLGSGWAGVADAVKDAVDIPYHELPAFPVLGVGGHAGLLRLGTLGGQNVMVLSGRKHAYETGDASVMKGVIRTLAALGCEVLLQTNAAGSLDPALRPGALMLVTDHLNIVQRSPLFDEPADGRFVSMADAYDPLLRAQAHATAARAGMPLDEGVYAWVMGPQFETPAEIRMLQVLGAQAVGMSTVPETILARHAGMHVLALSMITNMACGLSEEVLSHFHTLDTAAQAGEHAAQLVEAIVADLEL